ncbi:DNA glycosylase AlkZ-like family protein, partial [Leptospira sp. SA-E8]|uniref:DNA glycosylase AlkZ-like family protein n=1 Tax=Leptospira sp. SA-E8 TaxID=3422259 RepID=UPI003EB8C45A
RRYGYFVLPILSRGKLVGRLDAKAHRKEGVFEVKALYLEPGVRTSQRLIGDVRAAIRSCAEWHGTPQVMVGDAPADEAVAIATP